MGKTFNWAPRTRSKKLKTTICQILGYPTPTSFSRVSPRFVGQNFDVFAQQSNNLQIWNTEIVPGRRYVLVLLDRHSAVFDVKVVTSEQVAGFAKGQKRTTKLQARIPAGTPIGLLSDDTDTIKRLIKRKTIIGSGPNPVLPITEIEQRLRAVIRKKFSYIGAAQERLRGVAIQELVHERLGVPTYSDSGQFPDVVSQLVEVKLQTKATIDLGLVSPSDTHTLSFSPSGIDLQPKDIRYLIVNAKASTDKLSFEIESVRIVSGEHFFEFFPQTAGLVTNSKLQVHLPIEWFNRVRNT